MIKLIKIKYNKIQIMTGTSNSPNADTTSPVSIQHTPHNYTSLTILQQIACNLPITPKWCQLVVNFDAVQQTFQTTLVENERNENQSQRGSILVFPDEMFFDSFSFGSSRFSVIDAPQEILVHMSQKTSSAYHRFTGVVFDEHTKLHTLLKHYDPFVFPSVAVSKLECQLVGNSVRSVTPHSLNEFLHLLIPGSSIKFDPCLFVFIISESTAHDSKILNVFFDIVSLISAYPQLSQTAVQIRHFASTTANSQYSIHIFPLPLISSIPREL